MALSKSAVTWQVSATNTAGSTATGATIDLTGGYEQGVSGIIANGATGPTVGCDFVVEWSPDNGTTWIEYSRATAGVTASTTYYFTVALPDWMLYARSKFTGNTGQSVTVAAFGGKITAL